MKAIIIDDERRARVTLQLLLTEYCPDIELLAECENLSEGVKSIRKHKPDIVFLDIEMPGHSGLELLDFFNEEELDFSVIFTTAYSEYAIQAFKFSAIDYLLKPIDPQQLVEAITRFKKQNSRLERLTLLKENMQSADLQKIAVPSGSSLLFLETAKILYIKGEGAYSEVHFTDGSKTLISRTLKNFEDIICLDSRFVRIHKSYIANFAMVKSYNKSDGGSLELIGSSMQLPISIQKIDMILNKIQHIKL